MFTVHLALSALILHSYGQALRNVTKLHKLYFVTDLEQVLGLLSEFMNLYYIINFKKKRILNGMYKFSTKCHHLFYLDLNVLNYVALYQLDL